MEGNIRNSLSFLCQQNPNGFDLSLLQQFYLSNFKNSLNITQKVDSIADNSGLGFKVIGSKFLPLIIINSNNNTNHSLDNNNNNNQTNTNRSLDNNNNNNQINTNRSLD